MPRPTDLAVATPTSAEPGAVTIVQRQEVVMPRPLLATERNCTAVLGVEPRAFRRLLRLLEVPQLTTPDGPAALVEDITRGMRERGEPLPGEPGRKRRSRAVEVAPSEDDELAEAGLGRRAS